MFRWIKRIVVTGAVLALTCGVCAVTGLGSYVKSSGSLLKATLRDSVPVEFEIQRARDSLDGLIPAAHEALRDVAREEVEVASLEREIVKDRDSVAMETAKVQKLRSALDTQLASYHLGGRDYRRQDLVDELARRVDGLKTGELLLRGKENLLNSRRKALDAAITKLERTRTARLELANQVEALEAQHRLIQAQATGSCFQIDDSKLARTEKIIAELKKRLEVAQRTLAREAQFVESIPLDTPSESNVVESVDAYFSKKADAPAALPCPTPAVAAQTKI
jgi:hypothetical protein